VLEVAAGAEDRADELAELTVLRNDGETLSPPHVAQWKESPPRPATPWLGFVRSVFSAFVGTNELRLLRVAP